MTKFESMNEEQKIMSCLYNALQNCQRSLTSSQEVMSFELDEFREERKKMIDWLVIKLRLPQDAKYYD